MILFTILFISCFCAILVFAEAEYLIKKKKTGVDIANPHFSVSSYLDEIEKVHLSILEEQENREPYIITLWWGLDGIRLNDAGKVEWISRRTKPGPAPGSLLTNVHFNYNPYINTAFFQSPYLTYPYSYQHNDYGTQHMVNQINSNIQSQIDSIQRLQVQASQMAQNARLYESLSTGRDINGRVIRE